ncbi:hypothetical protein MKEN_00467600 [Mycena kentingensis (nom. inval.)]|nr:hypothetical protein MKEN_00467600 [Mycena kentingensis (nom. inval.)]
MFSDLCIDLVREIAVQLSPSERRVLRATTKSVNSALESGCFAEFRLRTSRLSTRQGRCLVSALVDSRWPLFATKICITTDMGTAGTDSPPADVELLVRELFGRFNGVLEIQWTALILEPNWLSTTVVQLVNSNAATLEHLSLSLDKRTYPNQWTADQIPWPRPDYGAPDYTDHIAALDTVCNLTKLTLDLRKSLATALHDVLTDLVARNPSLQTLNFNIDYQTAGVWRIMPHRTRTQIKLRSITSTGFSVELGRFLLGNPAAKGLTTLVLASFDAGHVKRNDLFATAFFEHVLPLHLDTLTELVIAPEYDSLWCARTHNAAVIGKLGSLRRLGMALHGHDLAFPESRIGQDPDPDEKPVSMSGRDGLRDLLHAIPPTLTHLTIHPTIPERPDGRRRFNGCGTGRLNRQRMCRKAIGTSLLEMGFVADAVGDFADGLFYMARDDESGTAQWQRLQVRLE